MGGDYPSSDFDIKEDGDLRLVLHAPTGMKIESTRLPADPIAVSSDYRVEFEGDVARPGEVALDPRIPVAESQDGHRPAFSLRRERRRE